MKNMEQNAPQDLFEEIKAELDNIYGRLNVVCEKVDELDGRTQKLATIQERLNQEASRNGN